MGGQVPIHSCPHSVVQQQQHNKWEIEFFMIENQLRNYFSHTFTGCHEKLFKMAILMIQILYKIYIKML